MRTLFFGLFMGKGKLPVWHREAELCQEEMSFWNQVRGKQMQIHLIPTKGRNAPFGGREIMRLKGMPFLCVFPERKRKS